MKKFNSAKLAELMRERHETNYRLAKEIGVSQSTVKNWLAGSNEPQLEKRGALAAHYGLPDDEFLA